MVEQPSQVECLCQTKLKSREKPPWCTPFFTSMVYTLLAWHVFTSMVYTFLHLHGVHPSGMAKERTLLSKPIEPPTCKQSKVKENATMVGKCRHGVHTSGMV